MEAAEDFLDKFAASSDGISRIGYVAFNTNAHKIFDLQSCKNESEATSLKNTMRTVTGNTISLERCTAIRWRVKINLYAENTASYDAGKKAISWDLKQSGYRHG